MEQFLEAKVIDSKHLQLKMPIDIAPGSTVRVIIELPEIVAENHAWYLLSSRSLEEAYGEEEPEYTVGMIKVPNPDYRP